MPNAPLAPCRVPGCRTLGPCAEHHALLKPAWAKWYHIARWRHPVWGLRSRALAASPLCVECHRAGAVVVATQVDHIVPHRGDPQWFWNLDNLQPICDRHHAEKTRRGE
jgi:5-methylcytosine-specific restriction protein A